MATFPMTAKSDPSARAKRQADHRRAEALELWQASDQTWQALDAIAKQLRVRTDRARDYLRSFGIEAPRKPRADVLQALARIAECGAMWRASDQTVEDIDAIAEHFGIGYTSARSLLRQAGAGKLPCRDRGATGEIRPELDNETRRQLDAACRGEYLRERVDPLGATPLAWAI